MIYKSNINPIDEAQEMEAFFESVEDRFEDSTILEAMSIIVGEQETNWTTFMEHVGLSELATVMEGQEVIYEGGRMESFIKAAKAWFEKQIEKIGEITKSFVAKIDSLAGPQSEFIKKYENKLKNVTIPADFTFKGYKFDNIKNPLKYGNGAPKTFSQAKEVLSKEFGKDDAYSALLKGANVKGGTYDARLRYYYYGSTEKVALSINVGEQLDIMRETKNLKKEAWNSYKKAHKDIKGIISELKKAEKEFSKEHKKDKSTEASNMQKAFDKLISYWKTYSMAVTKAHGIYLVAIGSRSRQAFSICTKIAMTALKPEKKEKPEVKTEGFVNTEAFLGAIEFI